MIWGYFGFFHSSEYIEMVKFFHHISRTPPYSTIKMERNISKKVID